jgi:hypothetical protein
VAGRRRYRRGVRAAAGEGAQAADRGVSAGAPGASGGAPGDRRQRADAGGVAGARVRRVPLRTGGERRRSVAAGNGRVRAAFAVGGTLQFVDGGDGVLLLCDRIGRGRQSGAGDAWGDGSALSVGRRGGVGGAPGVGAARCRAASTIGVGRGAEDAHGVYPGGRGAQNGRDVPRGFLGGERVGWEANTTHQRGCGSSGRGRACSSRSDRRTCASFHPQAEA